VGVGPVERAAGDRIVLVADGEGVVVPQPHRRGLLTDHRGQHVIEAQVADVGGEVGDVVVVGRDHHVDPFGRVGEHAGVVVDGAVGAVDRVDVEVGRHVAGGVEYPHQR